MAGYQFDELTKDLAGAKSRRGFLKGLLSAGLAAAGVGTVLSGVASAANTCGGGGCLVTGLGQGCHQEGCQCMSTNGNHGICCCPRQHVQNGKCAGPC